MNALSTLFPKARSEILKLLFLDGEQELHLRELTRKSGLTLGALQTEVEKLCGADLLLSRRDGNRRYFRANTQHPLFIDLKQIVTKTSGLHDALARVLHPHPKINAAFVFGSFADGSAKATSDIDLLIIGSLGLRALAPLLRPLTQDLGREINPVVFTSAEFVQQQNQSAFLQDVMAKEKLFIKGDARELAELG
jgi:predicted nucleotidyltransferase